MASVAVRPRKIRPASNRAAIGAEAAAIVLEWANSVVMRNTHGEIMYTTDGKPVAALVLEALRALEAKV
jgi:hypothetical protein